MFICIYILTLTHIGIGSINKATEDLKVRKGLKKIMLVIQLHFSSKKKYNSTEEKRELMQKIEEIFSILFFIFFARLKSL
jgi:hypothetical protein